ncbi:hypothetical protein KDK88_07565, partial [bacterium]|nr:hypothetical protein [bacterium]
MTTLDFHALLVGVTVAMIGLNWLVWRRTGTYVFALGGLMIYFWTFLGSWTLVRDLAALRYDTHYEYLFGKMFPVELDGDYFRALALYAVFGLVTFLTIYAVVPRREDPGAPGGPRPRLMVSHLRLIGMTGIAVLISFLLVRDRLAEAVIAGLSGYDVTAGPDSRDAAFLLHQLFSSFAVIPCALGVSVLVSGDAARFVGGRGSRPIALAYVGVSGMLLGFGMLMGNKNELFWGLVMGVAFYLVNAPRPRVLRLGLMGTAGVAVLGIIDFMRSLAIADLTTGFSWRKAGDAVVAVAASNEAFAAHFSMYGVLHNAVPLTWGTSVLSLVASLVPRGLWPDRPETIYQWYVDGVGALPGQGYTIHHATGWYLNFGWLGVFMGALVLGLVWAGLYRS